jgi:hypothetical protein
MEGWLRKINNTWYAITIEEGDWETRYLLHPYDTSIADRLSNIAGSGLEQTTFPFKVVDFWEMGIERSLKVATLIRDTAKDPTVSDDFQIGPDGAYEHTDDEQTEQK